MARGQLTFRQSDVTRAVKAVVAAGVPVAKVEVNRDGKIVVIAGNPDKTSADERLALDDWMAKHADQA